MWWSLSLSFGFWPLFLLADDVLPWCVYVVTTLDTVALDTHNKVAILVTDATAKWPPTFCLLWKSDKSPILQYFHTNLQNTICNALTLALHITNKRITKDTTNVLSVQPTQTVLFVHCLVFSIVCPYPVGINSNICKSCHSATQINTQMGNHHHYNK